jgi:hypothetical protein
MENRPAICSPRVPVSSPARSTLIPARTKVAGIRSEKYFRVSEASPPALVAMLRLWISSTLPTAAPSAPALTCDYS